MMKSLAAASIFALASFPAFARQQSSPPASGTGMEQMHHGHESGFMEEGMSHEIAKGVVLDQKIDSSAHAIVLRIGPISLPAHTSHMKMPQPPPLYWTIPFSGWLVAYHPAMVDPKGDPVPGRMLHHVAFWNENRPDFLCANKPEHIFGAGGELTQWAQIPGFGYRVEKGDQIRIDTMIYNPTDISYRGVYLQVKIPYLNDSTPAPVKDFYPAWMDVGSCGNSGYDLPAGPSSKTGEVTVKYGGVLLGVGGHMHDYAKQIVLEDTTRKETLATLEAKTDANGHLLWMPIVTYYATGGEELSAGDQLKITATYDNTTGKTLPEGAMGIVVGYFVPTNDEALAPLRHAAMPMRHDAHPMPPMSHDD